LVAQSEVLQGELAVATEEKGEEPKQVEQESDHRMRLWPDQDRQINHLPAGRSFGEGQAQFRRNVCDVATRFRIDH